MNHRLLLLALLLTAPAAATAQTIVGTADVTDGDTLSIGETKVRLRGIDAPEAQQTCQRDGADWACGEEATRQLQSLLAGRPVTCQGKEIDKHGRSVAVCESGGLELNRTMVEYGWATAFRRYSDDYIAEEFRAKSRRAGIWRSTFKLPEEWRAEKTFAAERQSPSPRAASQRRPHTRVVSNEHGCAIKGNRNRKGQWIYHLPGMPYYDATRPEELFCTETQAQAAGYRRAIVR